LALAWGAAAALAGEPGMAFIPGAEFQRGRTHAWPDKDLAWYPNPLKDDLPVRALRVDPFYLDEAEVTNGRYAAFVKATGHRAPYHWLHGVVREAEKNQPVMNVSWDDAVAYCTWDGGKRLPTEAEWEHACRGVAEGKTYPWGDREPTEADAHFDTLDGPTAVCSKTRNYFGLCDMIGNAWEWTADWYERDYYSAAPENNPTGPATGLYRVVRGGSWYDKPASMFMTCSYRSWTRPAERSPTIGFRCAKSFRATASDSGSAAR
jgi:formylglycine-generating enzyme required for sulfatase activity